MTKLWHSGVYGRPCAVSPRHGRKNGEGNLNNECANRLCAVTTTHLAYLIYAAIAIDIPLADMVGPFDRSLHQIYVDRRNSRPAPLDATFPPFEDPTTIPKRRKIKSPKVGQVQGNPYSKLPSHSEVDYLAPMCFVLSRDKHWRYISSYHVTSSLRYFLPSYILIVIGAHVLQAPDRAS